MATGFVDRFKGRTTFDAAALYVAGQPQYGSKSVSVVSTVAANASPGSSFVDGSTIPAYGITTVASSAGGVITMQAPQYAGQFKVIQVSTLATGSSLFIRMGSTATTTLNGSSFWIVKSTVGNSVLEFVATSTANWSFAGLNNSSATHGLSTTT